MSFFFGDGDYRPRLRLNRSSPREKWTIMKYMNDFHLMTTYAEALRRTNALSDENIAGILADMEKDGIYKPRQGASINTGKFKIIQIAWYLFGYYDKWSKKKSEEPRRVHASRQSSAG